MKNLIPTPNSKNIPVQSKSNNMNFSTFKSPKYSWVFMVLTIFFTFNVMANINSGGLDDSPTGPYLNPDAYEQMDYEAATTVNPDALNMSMAMSSGGSAAMMPPPTSTCSILVLTDNSRCPGGLGANTPSGVISYPDAAGMLDVAYGGQGGYMLDVNCISDDVSSIENIGFQLQTSVASTTSTYDCELIITQTYNVIDEVGNIANELLTTEMTISDTDEPVFDLACQFDLTYFTFDANDCPADAEISLAEGDIIDVNTSWTVGNINIPSLAGCVSDNCTPDNDLDINVNEITKIDDSCSSTLTITFSASDACGNISSDFVCNYTFVDNVAPDVTCSEFTDTFDGCPDAHGPNTPTGTWISIPASGMITTFVGGIFSSTMDVSTCITDDCNLMEYSLIASSEENRVPGCSVDLINEFAVRDACGNVSANTFQFRGTIGDFTAPDVTCSEFTDTFEGCPDFHGPNTPTGTWISIPASGMITTFVGGIFSSTMDVSACITDDCNLMEYSLIASSEENRVPGCSVDLINEFAVRDACGNVSANTFQFRGTIGDNTAPDVTCSEFTETFEGCPDFLGPNTPTGTWISIPASGMITTFVGGIFSSTMDVSTCITDDCNLMEYSLIASSEENRVPGCSVDLINEFAVRDACGNVSANTFQFRGTIEDNTAPVFDATCAIDETFPTSINGVCPDDAEISLAIGDVINVNDGWTVGGIAIPSLIGCVSDDCTDANDLDITVTDKTKTVDSCNSTLTITFVASDICGNESTDFTCSYTFIDDTNPEIVAGTEPLDQDLITQETDCSQYAIIFLPSVTDNCQAIGLGNYSITSDASPALAFSPISPGFNPNGGLDQYWTAVFPEGTTNVTITVDDGCGNSITHDLTITVTDLVPPAILNDSCPLDIATTTDDTDVDGNGNNCDVLTTFETPKYADNCDCTGMEICYTSADIDASLLPANELFPYTDGLPVFLDRIFHKGTTTVTFKLMDDAGNINDDCSFDVVVEDDDFPTFADQIDHALFTEDGADCPGVATLMDGAIPLAVGPFPFDGSYTAGGITINGPLSADFMDNCPEMYLEVFSINEVETTCDVTWTIEWQVTDCGGNTVIQDQIISITDNTAPVLTCALPITVQCDSDLSPATTGMSTALDACTGVVTPTYSDVSTQVADLEDCNHYSYIITRTWSVDDGCGNISTCDQTITVEDSTAPVIDCPADIFVQCDESTLPEGDGSGSDDGKAYLRSNTSIPWGETGNESAMDDVFGAGNWEDLRYETVDVSNLLTSANSFIFMEGGEAMANELEAFLDANLPAIEAWVSNGGSLIINSAPNEGDGISFGFGGVELTYPAINNDAAIAAPGHPIFSGPNLPVGTVDGTSAAHSIICPPGMTALMTGVSDGGVVLAESTWGNGNVIFGGLTLPVYYTSNFGFNQPISKNTLLNIISYAGNLANGTGFATASDNCDASPAITYSDVETPGTCDQEKTITRTWTATDACNNASNCVQTITVVDTQAPVITCPSEVTIACDASIDPAETGEATATDNCDPAPAITYADVDNQDPDPTVCGHYNYTITRTWTATDDCDNTISCTQDIIVQDTTAPMITCASDITIECDESTDPSNTGYTTATDNCDELPIITYVDGAPVPTVGCTYTITRTWTATDACGNNSSCDQVITVEDTTPPVVTNEPADQTVTATGTDCSQLVSILLPLATDNCQTLTSGNVIVSAAGINFTPNPFGYDPEGLHGHFWTGIFPLGTTIVTITVDDGCGNETVITHNITVIDVTEPFIKTPCPVDIFATTDGEDCDTTLTFQNPEYDDNCQCAEMEVCFTSADIDPSLIPTNVVYTGTSGNLANITATFYKGTTTVTFKVTDASGNINDDCSFDVLVEDNDDPTLADQTDHDFFTEEGADCPGVATLMDGANPLAVGSFPFDGSFTAGGLAVAGPLSSDFDDNCPEMYLDILSITPVLTTCNITWTIVWQVTDCGGNTASQDQVISITDDTAPVLTCAPDITVNCDADLTPAGTGTSTAVDACTAATVTFDDTSNQDPDALVCGHYNYTITRTWTAIDECMNETTCEQTITVQDGTAPVITCPGDLTIQCDDSIDPADTGAASATDNCDALPAVSHSDVVTPGSCDQESVITRTWTAADVCGNSITCVQTITIVDTEAPEITCPGEVTLECDDSQDPADTGVATAIDNCDPQPIITYADLSTQDPDPTSCLHYNYTITRTWTATDDCDNDNSCTQIINVQDTTAPMITCAVDITIECDESTDPSNTGSSTATDNCDLTPAIAYTDVVAPGACPQESFITRTWTATDACGNSTPCVQVITVVDTTAPEIVPGTEPMDQDLSAGAATCSQLVSIWAPLATDNCQIIDISHMSINAVDVNFSFPTFGYNPVVGASGFFWTGMFSTGTTIVTITVTDDCGNATDITHEITVTDDAKPFIKSPCPDDLLADTEPGICEATLTFQNPEYDDFCLCAEMIVCFTTTDPTVDPSSLPANITYPGTSGNFAMVTATFPKGTTTVTFKVSDPSGNVNEDCSFDVVIEDNEDPTFTLVPADVTIECDQPVPTEMATADDNCGTVVVTVASSTAPGSCQNESVITNTFTADDLCGNTATATQTITIVDSTAPLFTSVPGDLNLECDDPVPSEMATASDNCGSTTVTYADVTTGDDCTTTITRTFSAEDDCDNVSTAIQIITITDTQAPVVVTTPPDATIECNDPIPAGDATFTDNCDLNLTIEMTETEVGDGCPRVITRTWTATDDCDNSVSTSHTITINDSEAPVVESTPADEIIECDEAIPGGEATFSDNCDDDLTIEFTETESGDGCPLVITRTWTATDDCDNSVSTSQTITIDDSTSPIVESTPADVTIECDEVVPGGVATFSDNCDPNLDIAFTETESGDGCPLVLTRTWTATDDCGNSTSTTQTITIDDTIAPEVEFTPADITVECGDAIPGGTATFTDNCDNDLVVTMEEVDSGDGCPLFITRTWTTTDNCGNSTSTSQVITVNDTTAPTGTLSAASVSIECDELVPDGDATFTDNCDSNVEVTFTETSSGDGCPLVITRTWTGTDDCGNSGSVTQTITVNDNTAPVVTSSPEDATIECGDAISGESATFIDNCDHDLTITFTESESGVCPTILTRTWTAMDDCGNSTSTSQVITLDDTTAPTFDQQPPVDVDVPCDNIPSHEDLLITASDNCDSDVEIVITDELSFSGGCLGVIERTCEAIDDCGNSIVFIQYLHLTDTTAPELISTPADVTIICGDDLPTDEPVFVDNCDSDLEVTVVEDQSGPDCPYTITRTWTATDDCANMQTSTQTITVVVASTNLVQLDLKLFLQGPTNQSTGLMGDAMRVLPSFPLEEPYGPMGFDHYGNGGGEITTQEICEVTGEDAIVDWILVELRDVNDPSIVLHTKSALLQRDGDVVDADGVSNLFITDVNEAAYYISIRHRNHLCIRTAQSFIPGELVVLDMSALDFDVYGADLAMVVLGDKKVMVSGNANFDSQVNSVDKNTYWRNENGGEVIYTYFTIRADFNLDGVVNAIDKNTQWNSNNGKAEFVE